MDDVGALPQHVLDGHSQGALFDMRLRFAMTLLTTSPMYAEASQPSPEKLVEHALQVSGELFKQAGDLGYITKINHNATLSDELINQAKRMGAFQLWQQVGANEAQKEAASPIATLARRPGLNG